MYTISKYCWFARDVTAAMLVVKNKSISLLWELNSIFILMDKKLGETTNLCVEIMNSKRQVMGKFTWSRGTNSRLPFDIHVMLNLSRVTFTNGKGQIQVKNSQIENDQIKTAQNNPYG